MKLRLVAAGCGRFVEGCVGIDDVLGVIPVIAVDVDGVGVSVVVAGGWGLRYLWAR